MAKYWAATIEQGKRIIEMLRWWEAQPRRTTPLGTWTPFQRTVSGDKSVTFQYTGNETVNAMYTAKTLTDPTSASIALTSGTLTTASFGTLATANNAIVINILEALGYSNTGHDVTSTLNGFSTLSVGRIVNTRTDGTYIIHATTPYTGCVS